MRKVLFIAFALLTGCAYLQAGGGEKVVDSSGRQPKWIYGAEKEFIIVSAEAANVEDAKEKAMLNVKKHIMSSIAENVRASAKMNSSEVGVNGKYDIIETYESAVETESALIPFLGEVGISKVDEIYWEKIKKDKDHYFFRYHIKYPFSRFDLTRLSDEFMEREAKLDQQLEDFAKDDFSGYSSIEEMMKQLQQVRIFKSTLMERDPRRNSCANIEKAYSDNIKSITLRLISVNKQQLVYAPYFGENRLTTNIQPRLSSNCLSDMQYMSRGGECIVKYDFQTACYEGEENWLDVTLNVLNNKIKNRFIVK
jgi:hypothetical protein